MENFRSISQLVILNLENDDFKIPELNGAEDLFELYKKVVDKVYVDSITLDAPPKQEYKVLSEFGDNVIEFKPRS